VSKQAKVVFVRGGWGCNGNMWHLGEHTGGRCVCQMLLGMYWKHVTLGWTYRWKLYLSQGAGDIMETWDTSV